MRTILFFLAFLLMADQSILAMGAADKTDSKLMEFLKTKPNEDAFINWAQEEQVPIIEGDCPSAVYVSFAVWVSDREADAVFLVSKQLTKQQKMKKFAGTNVWTLSLKIEKPETFEYQFALQQDGNEVLIHDPLNPYIRHDKNFYSILRKEGSSLGATVLIPSVKSENPYQSVLTRDILVSLPAGYFQNLDMSYPVLYMHDGQQILDSAGAAWGGWKVDTAVESLVKAGEIKPVIVVGVYNSFRRDDEMMGWSRYHQEDVLKKKNQPIETTLSWAKAYDYFFAIEVKALIDKKFRTLADRENTAVGGASSGAMVALYELFTHADIYSKCAALSGGFPYYDDLRQDYFPNRSDSFIYLDCGTISLDAQLLPATQSMDSFLKDNGYVEGENYYYEEVRGGDHNERNWADRVPKFLKLFFPAN